MIVAGVEGALSSPNVPSLLSIASFKASVNGWFPAINLGDNVLEEPSALMSLTEISLKQTAAPSRDHPCSFCCLMRSGIKSSLTPVSRVNRSEPLTISCSLAGFGPVTAKEPVLFNLVSEPLVDLRLTYE